MLPNFIPLHVYFFFTCNISNLVDSSGPGLSLLIYFHLQKNPIDSILKNRYYRNIRFLRRGIRMEELEDIEDLEINPKLLLQGAINAPDGIFLLNKNGKIAWANKKAYGKLGFKKSELIGSKIFNIDPNFSEDDWQNHWNKVKREDEVTVESQHLKKDGSKIPVELSINHLDYSGEELHLTFVRDITERKAKQKKIERAYKEYKELINGMEDTAWVLDFDGNFLDVNNSAVEQLGYSREELLDMTPMDIDSALSPDKIMKLIKNIKQDETQRFETTHITKNGKEIPVEIIQGLITYHGEEAILSIARDITRRKEMEEKLKESEEKYRTVFENTGTATVIIKEDTTITLVNRKFEELSGYSREEIEGKKSWTDFVAEDDLERLKGIHNKRIKNGEKAPNKYEFDFIDKNNERHNIILIEENIPNSNKYVSSLTDITEKKKVKGQLQKSEQKYRRLVETTGDIIFIHDNKGIIKFANQSTLDFFNYDQEEIIGKPVTELIPESEIEDMLKRKKRRIEEQSKERFHFESTFINKNKEQIAIDVQSTPFFDKGEYKGELIIARDITQRVKAEQEKDKLREQLYQKQKLESIGTLAGGVAHDFNNLLTVILGMSDLAIKQTDRPKAKSSIQEVHEAGQKAAKLTDQLLLFSREKETEFKITDLNQVIIDLKKMLNRLIGEDIVVDTYFEEDIWNIKADKGQIEQAITNLAINARDAMPEGGTLYISTQNIVIDQEKAKATKDLESGRYVCLEIEDTGHGMDEGTQEKIFDPFFTTKGRAEGTGMGLAVVHGIIKEHNGIIKVYSESGEGTVFRIYIPTTEEEKGKNGVKRLGNLDQYKGSGEAILAIEDEKSVIRYLKNILKRYNYNCICAKDYNEALQKFKQNKKAIDLVITDIIMPGKNGLEIAEILKKKKNGLNIILTSGYSDQKIKKSEIEAKEYDFIQKPFDIKDLLEIISINI